MYTEKCASTLKKGWDNINIAKKTTRYKHIRYTYNINQAHYFTQTHIVEVGIGWGLGRIDGWARRESENKSVCIRVGIIYNIARLNLYRQFM